MARTESQNFGLQNPCAAEEGDGLDDCLAQQECSPAGGGEGVSMDVVVGVGAARTPWGEPMCVSVAEAEGGEEVIELPTFTLQDFKTLAVAPAASAVAASPDTLRGMHTNVFATAQPRQFTTELGGFPVQVRRAGPGPLGLRRRQHPRSHRAQRRPARTGRVGRADRNQ